MVSLPRRDVLIHCKRHKGDLGMNENQNHREHSGMLYKMEKAAEKKDFIPTIKILGEGGTEA